MVKCRWNDLACIHFPRVVRPTGLWSFTRDPKANLERASLLPTRSGLAAGERVSPRATRAPLRTPLERWAAPPFQRCPPGRGLTTRQSTPGQRMYPPGQRDGEIDWLLKNRMNQSSEFDVEET